MFRIGRILVLMGILAVIVVPLVEDHLTTVTFEGPPVDRDLFSRVENRLNAGVHFPVLRVPNDGGDHQHPENFTEKTEFLALVPRNYEPDGSWGLLVLMSPLDRTAIPKGWRAICQRRHLLLVIPQDASNDHFREWRVMLALKAYDEMFKRYTVNSSRVFLVGYSGGGRAASIAAVTWPDIFSGVICNCGVDAVSVNGQLKDTADAFDANTHYVDMAAQNSRFFLFTGSKDQNLEETRQVYRWMQKIGFQHVTFFEQEGAGHTEMSDENFEKGLDVIEQNK